MELSIIKKKVVLDSKDMKEFAQILYKSIASKMSEIRDEIFVIISQRNEKQTETIIDLLESRYPETTYHPTIQNVSEPLKDIVEKYAKEIIKNTENRLISSIKEREIESIADHVTANIIHCTKEVLTSAEAARYMGVSKSYLYRLTMNKQIPHYKPLGKMCYFNRHELEQWLQSNRYATDTELSQQAQGICMRKGGK